MSNAMRTVSLCLLGLSALAGPQAAWGQNAVARPARPDRRPATQPAADPAAMTPPAPRPGPAVILDTSGFWRMHQALRPPVIQYDDGPKPILFQQAWLDTETPPAPTGWTACDFDDSAWVRAVALRACRTPYLAQLCLRGRFEVTDPTKVGGLKLTVGCHGGAVVYVNGTEIARAGLPAGPLNDTTLAEGYPEEAYVTADGILLGTRAATGPEAAKRVAQRVRTLEAPIPTGVLRKGVNVVAIKVLRAPYHKIQEEKEVPDRGGRGQICLTWNTCEIKTVQLSASSADGLVTSAVRPQGLQAWNSDFLMSDFDMDFGDRCETLHPVKIVAARNGAFCGKVVVGSSQPIRGMKATAGELKSDQASIPASAVGIRYAIPWGDEHLTIPYSSQTYPYPRLANILGGLAESPLEEFPVRVKPPLDRRFALNTPNQPDPVPGAVVPVWITVSVPAGAKPGTYKGQIRVEAAGEKPLSVPVELKVANWALPDRQDYRTWVDMVQSPDTLALEYGVDLWSEKHWRMIEQSFQYIGRTGSRVVYVPLVAQTNLGAEQSMVRWIKKDANHYDYDFRIMDRYLDVAEKNMGKPKIVVFWVWEIYLIEKETYQGKDHLNLEQSIAAREAMRGTGPMVTVKDPSTGKVETVALPPYKDPASKALWGPLMAKVQEKVKARGLEKAMMLGMMNDTLPSKIEFQFFADLCPKVPWALHAHGGPRFNTLLGGVAPLGYKAQVWGVQFSAGKSLYGWKQPNLLAYYDRDRDMTPHTPLLWNSMAEISITGDQRGIGRLGADYWPVLKDKNGRKVGFVWGRYLQSSWRNLDLWSHSLAAGPDGPLATARFEAFRQGIQDCEARIVLEAALTDKAAREKLGDDLAARCQAALDERQLAMIMGLSHRQMNDTLNNRILSWRGGVELAGYMWLLGSGWQERTEKLYTLAGEVQNRLTAE